jgi:hypothetical protein
LINTLKKSSYLKQGFVGMNVKRSIYLTPIYISVVWILMISYQLFTQTAVTTLVFNVSELIPQIGGWLLSRLDMIIFIYAFAWVYLLSSVLPTIFLGKKCSVFIQFLVSLSLTFVAFVIQDGLIVLFEANTIDQILNLGIYFNNPVIAAGYLAIPYLLMIGLDLQSRKKMLIEKTLRQQVHAKLEPSHEPIIKDEKNPKMEFVA